MIVVGGALLLPLVPRPVRRVLMLVIPVVAMAFLWDLQAAYNAGDAALSYPLPIAILGQDIDLLRVDGLSLTFGWIFAIMLLVGGIYSQHVERAGEVTAGYLYAGSALCVVFCADLLGVFFFWEAMALASGYVVLCGKKAETEGAGLRYLCVHFLGGVFLLFGILLYFFDHGTFAFAPNWGELVGEHAATPAFDLMTPAGALILLGLCVNAAVPPLSAWLPDAYPSASPAGAVFLSAFTTKTAVYTLARGFAGTELLMWAGAAMTIIGIIWAMLENDSRRILAYSIINQVGFMVCGIGIGTQMAINGVAAHAFCHILYKALLFMSAGAVYYRTGKTKCTELGGLYRTMPLTLLAGCIGAAAISAVPWTSGFVSKSLTLGAAHEEGHTWVWLMLALASAGVFLHAGVKFPYFVFFNRESGLRPREAPWHMLIAMGIASAFCLVLGVWYTPLYEILPFKEQALEWGPHHLYSQGHVLAQWQLLAWSGVAFFGMLRWMKRTDTISLDSDWFYRRGTTAFIRFWDGPLTTVGQALARIFGEQIPRGVTWFTRNPVAAWNLGRASLRMMWLRAVADPQARIAEQEVSEQRAAYPADPQRGWPVGLAVLGATIFLIAYLLLTYGS